MASDYGAELRAAASDGRREQSTIQFPYLDLDTAFDVAKAVYGRSGLGSCELDELAAEMNQTMSGAFRLKTGTARIFELVEKDGKSGIKLTDLGRQIVVPDQERAARAEAFLRVPLYSKVYEKYRGHLLPPPKALEREMTAFGVSYKQADKARQAFERSARQAGYFDSGEDRLVRPRFENSFAENQESAQASLPTVTVERNAEGGKVNRSRSDYHPFVEGLLDELPSADDFSSWQLEDQAEWLRAAASIFKLLSKSKGRISITTNIETNPPTGANQSTDF